MDAFFAGIEPQHYFAEADAVPPAAFGGLQDDRFHCSILAGSTASRSIFSPLTLPDVRRGGPLFM
jgi:hypothetical protein